MEGKFAQNKNSKAYEHRRTSDLSEVAGKAYISGWPLLFKEESAREFMKWPIYTQQ